MDPFNFGWNSISVFLISFITSLALVRVYQRFVQEPNSTVPGPRGFPVIGHLPLLGKDPALTLTRWSKVYGNIFKIRMGSWPTLVLSSKDAIRNALLNYQEVFSDRPPFFTSKCLNEKTKSLAFASYTARWRVHRKIATIVLKKFTSSSCASTQNTFTQEAENITNNFLKQQGEHFNPHNDICSTVGRIIVQICYGASEKRKESGNISKLINNIIEFEKFVGAGNSLDVLPWLQYIMPWKAKKSRQMIRYNQNIAEIEVNEHYKSYDYEHHRDIADGLIAAAEHYGNSPDTYCGITKQDIFVTLADFTGAGFGTIAATMEWLLLYLSYHRQIQRQIQSEIDTVIGQRKPILEDRRQCPFTEATILETLRLAQVLPISLPHFTTKDTVFMGHEIKKATVVICNTYAIAMDETLWEKPREFRPKRFLNAKNEIISEKSDLVLAFSAGRRRCLGESFAKAELFLLTVNIFQRCDIELCGNPDFQVNYGLVCRPKPYQIKVSERR